MALFVLSAGMSNSQSEFCGKCPFFLERVTYSGKVQTFVFLMLEYKLSNACTHKNVSVTTEHLYTLSLTANELSSAFLFAFTDLECQEIAINIVQAFQCTLTVYYTVIYYMILNKYTGKLHV